VGRKAVGCVRLSLPRRSGQERRTTAERLPLRRAGRQLWEQGTATLESDAAFVDEGDEAVDISQYERRVESDDEDEVEGAAGRLRLADLSDED